MTLYEINQQIISLINEDGEIADFDAFEALQLAREQKIENIGCWYKNLTAEAKAIREEEKALADRRRAAENKAERLENYLSFILNGEKYSSPRLNVTYRKSEAVELDVTDEVFMQSMDGTEFVKVTPSINKQAIKDALKAGNTDIPAHLVERQNMQIK
jgi:hypothetical protein